MKIRVFFAGYILSLLLLLADSVIWILMTLDNGFRELNVFSWVVLIVFAGILPLGLFIWSNLTFKNVVEFNECGISLKMFGKVIRHFVWQDIVTIASTGGTFAGWIYISNKNKFYDYNHLTRMRLDREIIYFHQSRNAQQALLKYAPEKFKTQINQWLID